MEKKHELHGPKEMHKEIAHLKTKLAVLTDVILSNSELKAKYDDITNDKIKMDMYTKMFEEKE